MIDKKPQTSIKKYKNVNLTDKKLLHGEKSHKNVNLGNTKSQTSVKKCTKMQT